MAQTGQIDGNWAIFGRIQFIDGWSISAHQCLHALNHCARMQIVATAQRIAMSPHHAESFVIIGITRQGKTFRPSDWAERLCGVMSVFGAERRMAYSPYVQPGTEEGAKCVYVNARIRDIEPMAYTFLVNFAKDNDLKVTPWAPMSR